MRRLAIALLFAACTSEPDSVVEVGYVEYVGEPAVIEAPSSATTGVPLLVNVRTYGGGCVELESTAVTVTGDGVDITPYDRRQTGENQACILILKYLAHEASVVFDMPGTKTLRIQGRRWHRDGDELVEHSRTIAVH
ncbi:MAG: hypothetical protein H0T46_00755 [Deltaproteobacteria bacterium]|nr:hypothetical protein [Deltaproteobacteria bacterium]